MVLDLFEMLCGARLTYNYIRLGGVMTDVSPEWRQNARRNSSSTSSPAWTSTTPS